MKYVNSCPTIIGRIRKFQEDYIQDKIKYEKMDFETAHKESLKEIQKFVTQKVNEDKDFTKAYINELCKMIEPKDHEDR